MALCVCERERGREREREREREKCTAFLKFITLVFTDAWATVEESTCLVKTAEPVIHVHQGLEPVADVVWETAAFPQEKSAFLTHLPLWSASSTLVVS